MYKHYIRLSGNKIVYSFSDAFEEPLPSDIEIYEGPERHYNVKWLNDYGIPLYEYKNGQISEREFTAADLNTIQQIQAYSWTLSDNLELIILDELADGLNISNSLKQRLKKKRSLING